MIKKLLTTAAVLTLTGCASAIHGTTDQIYINSLEKGTTIYVNNIPKGRDNIVTEVSRRSKHEIRVEKDNCQSISETTGRKFDLTSLFGVLIDFGIVTIPADFVIGGALATSPTTYTLTPICKGK